MVSTVGSTLAAVALDLMLVPHYSVASATAAAFVLANGSSLHFVRRRLGFWPYGRRYVKPLLAGLAAAAITLRVRRLLPPSKAFRRCFSSRPSSASPSPAW